MRYLATAALALTTVFSTMTTTASDAEARRWNRHGGAIALGIAGAVIGGIALSRHRYYYDDFYYGGWGRPYYRRSFYYGGPRFYGGPAYYGRPFYGRPYYGRRVFYRGARFHRGWGGPAWGIRGGRWGRRWR